MKDIAEVFNQLNTATFHGVQGAQDAFALLDDLHEEGLNWTYDDDAHIFLITDLISAPTENERKRYPQ